MRYDELRRMAEAAIAGKDTDPLPRQAGQGNAFAILIVELLDEREEAEAKAAGMEAQRDAAIQARQSLLGLCVARDEGSRRFAAVVGWEEYFDDDAGGPGIGGDSVRPRVGWFASQDAAEAAVIGALGLAPASPPGGAA
jgi:hypothetical protein